MKRIFFIIFAVTIISHASVLEDIAFSAYKNGNYQKAITLYKKAAQNNSLKAILMLGLFVEQGIGVKKDKIKAIKLYKLILKKADNLKELLKENRVKDLEVVTIALKRLYLLTADKKYLKLAKKLKELSNRDFNKNRILGNNGIKREDFLIACPSANIVNAKYQEGISKYDCSLFENFPKRMDIFMKLKTLREEIINKYPTQKEKIAIIDKKIKKVVAPIIKFLEQESVDCYTNAKTLADIKACDYDFLIKSDPLLFDNASVKMEKDLAKKEIKNRVLNQDEKRLLINDLLEKISNGEYGKPYRNMVK